MMERLVASVGQTADAQNVSGRIVADTKETCRDCRVLERVTERTSKLRLLESGCPFKKM